MLSSERLSRTFATLFVLLFFLYLFGPLIVMSVSAFNSSAFPRVAPWECFTVEWFATLAEDRRLLNGLRNSVFIGFGVVLLAVPLGLAGALLLTQVRERVRPWYYTLVVSPILVPGVVLGISTLLFWDRVARMFGLSRDSIFYDGFFLTIIGQSTFIAAYTMLIFISRLQRFETVQEEAALDLGATHWQSFRKILLPFLKPAIGSAAVLAFLASFENYNTTVFTAISTNTLTKELASKVRYGIDPSISALAVTIIVLTLIGAAVHEVLKRREAARAEAGERLAAEPDSKPLGQKPWFLDTALILIVLVVIAGAGTAYLAGTLGVEECKAAVLENKQRQNAERIEALRERNRIKAEERAAEEAARDAAEGTAVGTATGTSADDAAPATSTGASAPAERGDRPGVGNFEGIFGGGGLAPGSGGSENDETDVEATPESRESSRPGTGNFEGIFGGGLAPGLDSVEEDGALEDEVGGNGAERE